jgi:formylglycine-generating enzyme required for sulfatase activity
MSTLEESILRVLNGKIVVGAAFLVSERLAVTCAHVVETAGGKPGGRVTLRLPDGTSMQATIVPDYWRGPKEEDVAVLQLDAPPPPVLKAADLGTSEGTQGHKFFTYGFPRPGQELSGGGEIVGRAVANGISYLQLSSPQVTPGFSGAPVFDESTQRVVGMVAAITPPDEYQRQGTTAFAVLTETILAVCPLLKSSDICPYRGLNIFTAETAQYFYGRETPTERLLGVLRGGCRFLAVFGPSGSGKSSLVHAGLLSALKKGQLPGGQRWMQIIMRPADNPFEQMKAAGLDPIDINGYLKSHADAERVVLFIDQFEELFTLCPADLRDRFARDLAIALENSKLILILSMRDDFYSTFLAKAAPLAESEHLKIENVPGDLKHDELSAMIERPAEAVGLALEEGLTDLIMKDLTRDGEARSTTLPLLEFALTQLWERRRDGLLTHEAYQAIGGVTGSLARWADDACSNLPKAEHSRVEGLLTSLVHLGDEALGLPDTRQSRPLTEFDEDARHLIGYFTDRRLIVTGDGMVELIHDALVGEWGRLQDWVKKDREHLRLREAMREAARQWEASKRDNYLLNHRGARLKSVLEISKDQKYQISLIEQGYLDACVRAEKRQRLMNSFLVLTLIVIVGSASWAFLSKERAVPGQWVSIPAGSFVMGMDEKERKLAYSLCLDGALDPKQCTSLDGLIAESGRQIDAWLPQFDIMDNEVTNAQYQQCVDDSGCTAPKDWNYAKNNSNRPATNLNWFQAGAYCLWLGGRLPTEGEWEKAARGPYNYSYPWGNNWDPLKSNLEHYGNGTVKSIAQYAGTDISGYLIKNMAGNVQEWTASEALPVAPDQTFSNNVLIREDNSVDWPVIVRGGSWILERSQGMAAKRGTDGVLDRRETLGFRCVCPKSQTCKSPWNWVWIWFGKY